MRILVVLLISLSLPSCKKSADNSTARLWRTEATDNYDHVLHTEYSYDNNNHVNLIKQYENNDEPVIAATINYNANEVVIISYPDIEPAYNQTMKVHLWLDENGRLLKRIEYVHGVSKTPPANSSKTFRYDTLLCAYDAEGLLKSTTSSSYDSAYINATHNIVTRFTSAASYANDRGDLASIDENVTYPRVIRADGISTASGGSSEYHSVFSYTKAFPNHADFKNAAVLNKYNPYYEPPVNSAYKNMPDQITRSSIDKDINGVIIFSGTTIIDIERNYNNEGLLSAVNILSYNTPYKLINYFYGR